MRHEGGTVRDVRDDFEADLDRFARQLAWCDAVSYALMVPLLVLLAWWLLRG